MHRGPRFALLIALLAPCAWAGDTPMPSLPQPAPDWTIELTAKGGEFAATAMVSAPDGILYLGQADGVVAFRDGKTTGFADTLGKVHGLEWTGGSLLVAHGPFLSILRDVDSDGRSDQRQDLVTGLEPKASDGPLARERCLGGIRLGLDGFVYMAVGDQGIPRAVGKDGRTISLRGGGVIRVRPDGTGLEAISTGDCNPRSVAISATGDIFTFGPGDPRNRWPGGLIHHIDGGHYGYPYQFLTAPFRSLPALGGEAGTEVGQGICYEEDGLPLQYRGNLFVCDTSRQRVDRIEIRKSGGTFAIARRTALITKGSGIDFHPSALTTTRDGTGFWVADRPRDGNRSGKLYGWPTTARIGSPPRPGLPAMTSPRGSNRWTTPALSVRLKSQRSLADRGPAAVPGLTRRLKSEQAETGRLHALWRWMRLKRTKHA